MRVDEAAEVRTRKTFDNFDRVYVSFSGGKDSGVMLNLAVKVASDMGCLNRLSVYHMDYEAQYQQTTDYVEQVKQSLPKQVKFYHICMPIAAQCCTAIDQPFWTPWDSKAKDIWVRKMPEDAINIENHEFDFWRDGMSDYEFQDKFGEWLKSKTGAKSVACMVGIRTQESMNRWRAIHSDRNYRKFKNWVWSKKMADGVYNVYPIYDWRTTDIWTANAKNGWSYNKLYDLYYQAGVPIEKMRVASPFNDSAANNLHLYQVLDPKTWGKMVGRTSGVNFTALYGNTTAMGWRGITKPDRFTWKQYAEFLLKTLPEKAREHYQSKLDTSLKFWAETGGALDADTISDLKSRGVEIKASKTNRSSRKEAVKMQYLDDYDGKAFREVPTYKRFCVCILKNDWYCKYMGFAQTKYEIEKRKSAITKWEGLL